MSCNENKAFLARSPLCLLQNNAIMNVNFYFITSVIKSQLHFTNEEKSGLKNVKQF